MPSSQPPAFTDTRRFKVMRAVMGAATPAVRAILGRGTGGRLGRALMLLRFRGRRTGRSYTTPVGYVRDGNTIVVVTSPAYRWWRNVVGGTEVEVRLDGRWHTGTARVVLPDDPAYDETVALQVAGRGPGMLRAFGVEVDDAGRVPDAARATAAERAHLVRIELDAATPAP